MGKSCCVKGCKNRFTKGSGISFHRFPTEPEQKTLWIQTMQSLNRFDWQPTMYTWVCGDHFQTGAYIIFFPPFLFLWLINTAYKYGMYNKL
jgi:hypothetical protein